MAILSNVNGKFAVDSTGAIQFSGSAGTSGYILRSNGNAAPTWVDSSTVIGGPYLPLAGGTLTGATATASGITFTSGGTISVNATTSLLLALNSTNANGGYLRIMKSGATEFFIGTRDSVSGTSGTGYDIYTIAGNDLRFFTNGTNLALTIDTSQNVGIGTDLPTSKLHLRDPGTNSDVGIKIGNDSRDWNLKVMGSVSDSLQFFTHDNSNVITILPSGNVGIGTDLPQGKVDIQYDMDVDTGSITGLTAGRFQYGNINFSGVTAQTSGAAGTTMQGITWQVNNYQGSTNYGNQAQLVVGNNGSIGTFMGFFTSDNYSVAPVEAIRIDSTQNVGIGTSSPQERLHVVGLDGSVPLSSYYGSLVVDNNGEAAMSIIGNSYSSIYFGDAATNFAGGVIYEHSSNSMNFRTNGNSEKMRITSAGYLKVGSTTTDGFHEFVQSNTNGEWSTVVRAKTVLPYGLLVNYTTSPNNNSNNPFHFSDATATRFFMYSNGAIYNNGTYGTVSDRKLKENIVDATLKLDDINKLKVRNFNFKDKPEEKHIGFIAQELEEVFPKAVENSQDRDSDGKIIKDSYTKTIKTSILIPMLVKSIQELEARIKELENK